MTRDGHARVGRVHGERNLELLLIDEVGQQGIGKEIHEHRHARAEGRAATRAISVVRTGRRAVPRPVQRPVQRHTHHEREQPKRHERLHPGRAGSREQRRFHAEQQDEEWGHREQRLSPVIGPRTSNVIGWCLPRHPFGHDPQERDERERQQCGRRRLREQPQALRFERPHGHSFERERDDTRDEKPKERPLRQIAAILVVHPDLRPQQDAPDDESGEEHTDVRGGLEHHGVMVTRGAQRGEDADAARARDQQRSSSRRGAVALSIEDPSERGKQWQRHQRHDGGSQRNVPGVEVHQRRRRELRGGDHENRAPAGMAGAS